METKNIVEDMRTSDLSPKMVAQFTEPKKTWFLERTGDHFVFACEEMEAWRILTNRSGWTRTDFKIVGVSDGKTYAKIIKESKSKSMEIKKKIAEVDAECNKYRATEERFVFTELLDITDPKVKKVRTIIAKYDKELEKLNEEYFAMSKNVAKTAFDAELKAAKRNPKEFPSNQDVVTPGAVGRQRNKIVRSMGLD